jgi:hypothetical protein
MGFFNLGWSSLGERNPNGVELVLSEVRKHSGELSNARDFPMAHHRTARAVPLTQRHSNETPGSTPKLLQSYEGAALARNDSYTKLKVEHQAESIQRGFGRGKLRTGADRSAPNFHRLRSAMTPEADTIAKRRWTSRPGQNTCIIDSTNIGQVYTQAKRRRK